MKVKTSRYKGAKSERAHGVDKPSRRDKKENERSSIGYGMRAHEERFNKERIATLNANRQERFIEKVKAKEQNHSPKTHE